MIFSGVADAVIKHYKKILVIWIVVFILSGYFAMRANDVVVTEDSQMAPPNIESARADDIIAAQFEQTANSSAIIVLRHDDMRSPQMTTYVLDVEQKIREESTAECTGEAKIKCFDSITTVYSVYRDIINATAASLAPVLHDTEANVTGLAFMIYGLPYIYVQVWDGVSGNINGTAYMVYGLPAGYLQAVDGVNQTSFLLYGVPSMFAQTWDGVNGSALMLYGVPSMFAQAWDGVNGTALMLYGIPSMFAQTWDGVNGTALMLYGIPSMFADVWYGVNNTALMLYGIPYMYEQTWTNVNQTAGLIYGGPSAYLQAWEALGADETYNNDAFNLSWAQLNATISDPGQQVYVKGYQQAFYQNWDSSFNSASSLYEPPLTPSTTRANDIVNATAPVYFDFTTPTNQSQLFMAGVWKAFGVTNFTEPWLLNAFTKTSAWQTLEAQTSGLSPDQMSLFSGYFGSFAKQWNVTFYNTSTQNLSAPARATVVIGQIAPTYIDQVSSTDPAMRQMMMGVLQAFDLTNWSDPIAQNIYTDGMFKTNIQMMIGGFGLSPEEQQELWSYYDTFYQGWNGSFANTSLQSSSALERAEAVVHQVAPSFIASVLQSPGADPRSGPMLYNVLNYFNTTDWNQTDLIDQVTNQTFYSTMQAMIGGLGLPGAQEDQLWLFYDGFYSSWKGTYQGQTQYSTSLARAEAAIKAFAPGFIAYVRSTDPIQADMLQGVLDGFNTTNWNSTDQLNSYARFYFINMLSSMTTSMGVPQSQADQMLNYFNMFSAEWDKSFTDLKQSGLSSPERAQNAALASAPAFIDDITVGDEFQRTFLQGVLYDFNITTWNDTAKMNEFSRATFTTSLSSMASGKGISSDELQRLLKYFDMFYVHWNASFSLPLLQDYNSTDRAEYAVKAAGPGFIDEIAAGNQTIKDTMLGVLNDLDITTWNDTARIDQHAYGLVRANLDYTGASQGMSQSDLLKAQNYLLAFYNSWKVSYEISHLKHDTQRMRAEWAIPRAVVNFTANLSADEANYILDVQAGLNFDNSKDTTAQEFLANSMTSERAWNTVRGILENMTGSQTMNDTMRQQIEAYFNAFDHNWNWSFVPASANYMPRGTSSLVRGKAIVDATAPDFFGFTTPHDEATMFMHGVWANFTMRTWSDTSAAHNFTIDFIYSSMTSPSGGAIQFKKAFFEQIYSLGPSPTSAALKKFTEGILRNGTLDTYPITLSHSIISNFINEKNDTMIIALGFNKGTGGKFSQRIKDGLAECGGLSRRTGKAEGITNLKVYVSGSAPLDMQLNESVNSDINRIDIVTVIVVLVLISLFFRSFVTSTIPLMIIGAAIMVTYGVIFIVGSYFIKIHYTVITLTFTALMGAGVDYCIFIIARYKEERGKGKPKEEALRTSVTWAGESITTSGVAVMIGFGSLSVLTFSMLQGMGVILPIGIGISILVALTFLPSIIMLVGDGIFWMPAFIRKAREAKERKQKKLRERELRAARMKAAVGPKEDKDGGRIEYDRHKVFYFSSAVDAATKYAKVILLIALVISIPAAVTVYSLQTSYDVFTGLPDSEAKRGLDAMADGFGRSRGMETKVVIEMGNPIYDNATGTYDTDVLNSIDGLAQHISALSAVRRVDVSSYSEGSRIDSVDCWSSFGPQWKESCLSQAVGKFNSTVVITVTFKEQPFSKNSIDSVKTIREVVKSTKNKDPILAGAKILVGGATAGETDIETLVTANMQQMRIIVVVAIFILLVVVLGSILIPVTAIVSIGLSISWTLAVAMLLFQYVRGMPLMWLMPIILFVVLMGLGMDYNIFIMTRMREEVLRGYSDRVAIRRTVERTGGIITACGAIMAGAFGSMMLSAMGLLQQFGFALFFAIVLDAFIIRIYVMPAIVVLLKKWNWWAPGPLQRVKRDKQGHVIVKGGKVTDEDALEEE